MLTLTKRIIKTSTKEVYEHLHGIGGFTPDFDGNAMAWYDGDVDLSAATWGDQSTNGRDITFTNSPAVISNAVNGHDAIRFNGTDESGQTSGFDTPQPITIYAVINSITWTSNDHLICSRAGNSKKLLQGFAATPALSGASATVLPLTASLALGTFGIITLVFNGVSSEIRLNDNVADSGDMGVVGNTGLTIGAFQTPSNWANCEFAYLIIRSVADATAIQDRFINWLEARFAL